MKIKYLLLCVTLAGVASLAYAEKVSPDQAKLVARNFYYEKVSQYRQAVSYNSIEISTTYTETDDNEATYYVFNMNEGGYVIVSAEDVLTPVFGYSYTGAFYLKENMDNLLGWMKHYNDLVVWSRQTNYQADNATVESWQHYRTTDFSTLNTRGGRDTGPLLISLWDQGGPYNILCPTVSSGGDAGHVWAGCVATCMAQIMYYWRYPLVGSGSHTYYLPNYGYQTANFGETYYDWNAMQNQYTNNSPAQSVFAVAQLTYHTAVAVNMQFGPNGSGAQSSSVPPALKTYFNYSSSATYSERQNYTQSVWESMLINNLDNLRPVYYSGDDGTTGHAFVCDGYQQGTPNYFHFNFGWSGADNGYFTVNNPDGFAYNQAIVRNIHPDDATYTYPYFCNGPSVINTTSGTIEDGSGPEEDYQNNTNCNWLITPKDGDSVVYYTLGFEQFNTGSNDVVSIYDGETTSAPSLGSYSGSQLPGDVQSTGDHVLVTFISDGTGTAPGWQMKITPHKPTYCVTQINLTEPTGTFTDGSGAKNYLENSLCRWRIVVPNANHITISFTSFNLELNYDSVQILDLSTSPPLILGSFTGSFVPPNVTGVGPLMVIFRTNNIINSGGFEAYYEIDNVGVEEQNLFTYFNAYPNPVDNTLNLNFNAKKSQKVDISLLNLTGSIIYSKSLDVNEGYQSATLDVTNLTGGVYILQLKSDNGVMTRKVVVQ
jgi:hypothetical protein